jgi:hypothetical protein
MFGTTSQFHYFSSVSSKAGCQPAGVISHSQQGHLIFDLLRVGQVAVVE